jgi:hypothetical protein
MKKAILIFVIAAIFTACKSRSTEETALIQSASTADTAGLAQFKQWKEKQDLGVSEETLPEQSFTTESVNEPVESTQPVRVISKPAKKMIYRTVPAKEERVAKVTPAAPRGASGTGVRTSRSRTTDPLPAPSDNESTAGTSGAGEGSGVSNGDVASTTPAEVEKPKNEGWSKAAKGTAIGAGSGAVLGAILSKNKGKGAVIGGIVGAAGGYVLGRKQDKKDGRYLVE